MSSITVVAPSASVLNSDPSVTIHAIAAQTPLSPFSQQSVSFIQHLAKQLLQPTVKAYPELVALGFWLRTLTRSRSDMRSHAEKNERDTRIIQKALGTVVHFTPANVDTMFIYSWICGLLMGNNNIVRVATQNTPMQQVLFKLVNDALQQPDFIDIAQRNIFVRYDKSNHWSATLSQLADARILWGGDVSVLAIRALPSKPRSRDISFADRYSAALIHADAVASHEQLAEVADALWRDTQPYSQQACSSPKVIFWVGSSTKMNAFFERVNTLAAKSAEPSITRKNEQLVLEQWCLATRNARLQMSKVISVISLAEFDSGVLAMHNGQLTYVVVQVESLDALVKYCDGKLQTIGYAGIEQSTLVQFISQPSIQGIDRVVPLGRALDFDVMWDGFDLMGSVSRHVSLS
ncbi:acyl-CoA reductase [Alteromonas oceanisediminis]|uniref:acyl-CoA reductase n=1 Tax=Alteromonas oceanisediminis TaxID=2836180 RepID=UPI001BDA627E|nr:acyl-CoA reductase [Alteromonas oceanisediminis]MBT0584943.1 hypothetical protein [Alteromonas oceanisediminis]